MSTPTKNESPEPLPMKPESLDDISLTPEDAINTNADASESSQSASQDSIGRRPRNPFILFRTWYIKQGHLKQVTSSGSELSKITGKLWKAMHEDDRKFWAEQARKEREASLGRTYTPAAPSKPRTGRQPRKKTSTGSSVRYCPMTARAPDPVDERMDDIVQLIIAGKTGDEIGGELRKKKPSGSQPVAGVSVETSSLPLLAPVPRSARASVSLDALELQSRLSGAQFEQESTGTSLSPDNSLQDLPATPEHSLMSGYHTPYDVQYSYSGALNLPADQSLHQNQTPDFSFNAPSLGDCSGSIDAETWTLAETPDASCVFQPHPTPPSHKEYPEPSQFDYPQGWGYYTPAPVYTLNYPPASFDMSGHSNYASHSLVPSASWHGPDSVSAYDVPGHIQTTHTGDLAWPSEWVNDSY